MLSHLSTNAMIAALIFGALHALEPGHGKTALVAYMADGRKSLWHSVVIGGASFFSHTASILLISFVVHTATHVAGEHTQAHEVTWYVSLVSSVALLALGFVLLARSFRKGVATHKHCCGHDHAQVHAHDHAGPIEQRQPSAKRTKFTMSAILGVSVGLYPCPTAIAAYLTALSNGDIGSGYLAILVYGVGIGFTMVAVGYGSSVLGRSFLSRLTKRLTPALILRVQSCIFLLVGFTQLFHVHG